MPRYHVNDDHGNTLILEGDSPPTEQELEDIFSVHGKQGLVGNSPVESSQHPDTQYNLDVPQAVLPSSFAAPVTGNQDQSVGQELKAFVPDAITEAGSLVKSIPEEASAFASLFKRPDNQPVGMLPSLSAVKNAIAQNTPFAEENMGNISAALRGDVHPIENALTESATESLPAATLARVSQGLAATAPLAAIGGLPTWASKLVTAGFAVDMIRKAPELFNTYAEEINKPEAEQDPNKIATLQSDIAQTFAFAPAAGGHGVGSLEPAFNTAKSLFKGGERDASQISQAAEVHGNVQPARAEAQDVQQNQPGGGQGVRAQTGGGLQEAQVALSPEHQKFGSDYVAGNGEAAARTRLTQLDREAAAATASGDQARAQQVAGRANGLREALGEPAKPVATETAAPSVTSASQKLGSEAKTLGEFDELVNTTREAAIKKVEDLYENAKEEKRKSGGKNPIRVKNLTAWLKSIGLPDQGKISVTRFENEFSHGYNGSEAARRAALDLSNFMVGEQPKAVLDDIRGQRVKMIQARLEGDKIKPGQMREGMENELKSHLDAIEKEKVGGPLSAQENQHFEQLQNDYYSGHDMSPEEASAHAAYEARVKANAPVVERQEVPYATAQDEFKFEAARNGYKGDVAFIPEANMAQGDALKSSWAIWNPKSGRIEVNADAWNRLGDAGRKRLVESVASEEAIHSLTSDEDALEFLNHSTGVQRAIGRRIYGAGARDVKIDDRVLGHEMLRRTVQRLQGIKPTEIAELVGREGWTVKSLDTLDHIINRSRQLLGTEASQRQIEILDKVHTNIGLAITAIESGALRSPQRQQEKANDIADEIGHTFKPVGTFQPEGMPPELVAQLQPLADKYGWEFTNKKTGITFYTRKGASPAEIADAYKAKYGQEMPGQALASPQRPEKTQEIKDTEEKLGLRHDGTVGGRDQWTIIRNGVQESTFITKKDASLDQIKTKMEAIEAGTLSAPQRKTTPLTAQKDAIEKHLDKIRPGWRDEFGMSWDDIPDDVRRYFQKLDEIDWRNKEWNLISETHWYDENMQRWVRRDNPGQQSFSAAPRRDENAPDFGDYNDVFDDAVKKITGARNHNEASKILEDIQKSLGAQVDDNMRKLYGPSKGYENSEKLYKQARELTKIIRGLGDEDRNRWGDEFLNRRGDNPDQQSFSAAPQRSSLIEDIISKAERDFREAEKSDDPNQRRAGMAKVRTELEDRSLEIEDKIQNYGGSWNNSDKRIDLSRVLPAHREQVQNLTQALFRIFDKMDQLSDRGPVAMAAPQRGMNYSEPPKDYREFMHASASQFDRIRRMDIEDAQVQVNKLSKVLEDRMRATRQKMGDLHDEIIDKADNAAEERAAFGLDDFTTDEARTGRSWEMLWGEMDDAEAQWHELDKMHRNIGVWMDRRGMQIKEDPGQLELLAPQRGMSSAEQRRIEEQRKYRELMIAKGEGQTGTMAERHAAAYAPPTPESIQNIADQVISTKEPSKSAFVSAVRTRHGDIQPGQVEDMWADAVNKKLASATGKELEDMVENLGLRRQVFGQTTSSGKGFGLPDGPRVRISNKGTIADVTAPETRTAQQAASEQAIKLLERASDLESKARIAKTQIDTDSFNQKAAILRRAADNLKAAAETGEGLQMDQPSLFPGVAEQQATYTRGTEIKGKPQRAEIERGGQVKARERAMSAIFRKLVGEEPAEAIRAGLTRKEITPQDIRWTDPRISEGSSEVIRVTEPDLEDTSELGMRLTEGAGTSASTTRMSAGGERKFKREALPRSATKRVVALLDKRTKQVHLVSAYRDGHRGPVFLDPSSVTREHRTLDQLVGRYRPLYSVLLDKPVKDFKQTFKSVKEFSEKFSGQIQRVANRIGERGIGSDPFIEGTPGLEGEGGIAQGPDAGWMRDALGMTTGTLESGAKLTGQEARAAYQAFRFIENADDASYVISQLRKRAEKKLLRPRDRVLIAAMSKVNDALIEKHAGEGLTPGQLYEETLNELHSLAQRTTKQAAFVDAAAREFAQGHGLPPEAQAQAPSPFSRELTMPIDRVPPTTVRPEQVPPGSKPVPTGATGNEQVPPRDLPPPGAQRIIYETIHRQLRQEANKPATPEEQALRMRLLDQRAQQKAADIERMRKAMLKPAQPKEAGPQGELGLTERKPVGDETSLSAPRRGEDVHPDVESPIPRFIHNASSALTQASGIERIPLVGKLWSDRARIQGPEDREIVAYSVKRQIGNSQAAIVGARMAALNEKLGTPFKQDHNGKITNLDAPFEQSKYPSDVFEDWQRQTIVPEKMYASRAFSEAEISAYSERHPSTIKLTPAQDKFFRAMLGVVEDGYKYLNEKNAKLDMHNGESMETRRDQILMKGLPSGVEVYPLSRVALFKRAVGPVTTEIRRRIGGQYSVERDRLYNTEREGQPTTAYEPDMTKRLTTFVARVYKSVADADLANSPALRGETPVERGPRLAKEYQEDLLSGRMKVRDIANMAHTPRLGIEAEVPGHPAFAGKIYPQDIANKLNKAFGESSHRWVRTAGELNKLSKALMLTGDLAQYLQQGSAIMFGYSKSWANATTESLKSLAVNNGFGRLLLNPENMKAATEFVQSGGSMGHLQDFMAGSDPGEIATKIPGFRQVVIRSGRAFGVFMDVAKLEMWKSLREVTPRSEWPQVIEMIENSAMSGKMESAGMNPARAVGERIAFMASSYYRGALNLVAGLAERGMAGKVARKTIGSYAAGVTLSMVSLYLAAGMSWEEIRKRLTPGQDNQKFLKFPVKIGGDTVEIGPGGILISLANLGADVAVTTATHPTDMGLSKKNPLLKWLMLRLGPVPAAGKKLATQENVFGRPTGISDAALSAVTPIPVQKGFQVASSGNKGAAGVSMASSFFGLDSQRYHAAKEIYDLADKYMKDQGLKKDSGWDEVENDEPSYTKLRGAISGGSQSRFNDIYKKMSESHTDWEMVRSMRQWARAPFTGSRKAEQMFRSELTDYQDKVYEQAQDERERVLDEFMDMLDHTP